MPIFESTLPCFRLLLGADDAGREVAGHPFHGHSADGSMTIRPGQSERSDAGNALLLGGWGARQWLGLALAHGLPF